MALPLLAIGAASSAIPAAASFLGSRKARRAKRKARHIQKARIGRAQERLADSYRRRGIGLAEQNVGLEGSGVAKSRENQLAQSKAWDMADLNDTSKLASIESKLGDYYDRLQNVQDISGIVGGVAGGISSLMPEDPLSRALRLSKAGSTAYGYGPGY